MNAIVVPAARPVSHDYVGQVAAVAKETRTRLLILASHDAGSGAMADLLDNMAVPEWWVVKVPDKGLAPPFMTFQSPDMIPDHARRLPPSNLSDKRNLGSLVGRVMGWERLTFSDDDVRFEAAALRALSLVLPGRKIAGMLCTTEFGLGHTRSGFPDKDVIHQARDALVRIHFPARVRACHEYEDVAHISGNSIATNPQTSGLVFPPKIYDEDLIAFHGIGIYREEDAAALSLDSRYYQATYDPFADPDRAKYEAFGEMVHDALFLPIHDERPADITDRKYWDGIITQRIEKIETLIGVLNAPQDRGKFNYMTTPPKRNPAQEEKIRRSLQVALDMNRTFTGSMGVEYMRAWADDREVWQSKVAALTRKKSLPGALDWLGVSYVTNVA
ncbi:MAG TPA: hypothetical protein VGM08_00870 [Candidatus Saccharimonadales bacterium]